MIGKADGACRASLERNIRVLFRSKLILVVTGAGTMWTFPSFGTQGMGTLRQGISHPDRYLFSDHTNRLYIGSFLQHTDHEVDNAVMDHGPRYTVTGAGEQRRTDELRRSGLKLS